MAKKLVGNDPDQVPTNGDLGTLAFQDSDSAIIKNVSLTGAYTETVFEVTGTTPALSPENGTIQTWDLSGNSTPTAGTWDEGMSLTLLIDDGSSRTVTWSSLSVTWVGGSAPTLATSGYTVIQLFKVESTIYGALVGFTS